MNGKHFCFKSCEKSPRSLKDALDGDGTGAGMRLEGGWRMAGGGSGRRDIVKALPWCPVHALTCRLTNHTLPIPVTNLHSQPSLPHGWPSNILLVPCSPSSLNVKPWSGVSPGDVAANRDGPQGIGNV